MNRNRTKPKVQFPLASRVSCSSRGGVSAGPFSIGGDTRLAATAVAPLNRRRRSQIPTSNPAAAKMGKALDASPSCWPEADRGLGCRLRLVAIPESELHPVFLLWKRGPAFQPGKKACWPGPPYADWGREIQPTDNPPLLVKRRHYQPI